MALFEDGKIHIPKKKAEPKPVAPDVFKPQPPAVVQKIITAKKATPPTPPKATTPYYTPATPSGTILPGMTVKKGKIVTPTTTTPKPTVTLAPETITRIEEYKKEKETTPYEYIKEHTEPQSRIAMEKAETFAALPVGMFGGMGEKAQEQAISSAYGHLSAEEKQEYGYKYTDWKKIPVDEVSNYPGFSQYYSSLSPGQQEKTIKEFRESSKFKEYIDTTKGYGQLTSIAQSQHEKLLKEPQVLVPGWINPFGGDIKQPQWMADLNVAAVSVFDFEKAEKELAKKMLLEKTALDEKIFESLGIRTSSIRSYGEAALSLSLFPVTLTQTGMKYITGTGAWTDPLGKISTGKTFLPDVSKTLSESKVSRVEGVIGGTIGTALTLGKSGFIESSQKYPWQTAFATVGEISGLTVGSAGVRAAYGGTIRAGGAIRGFASKYGAKLPSYTQISYHFPQRIIRRAWVKWGTKDIESTMGLPYHSTATLTPKGLSYAPGKAPDTIKWTIKKASESRGLPHAEGDILLGSSSGGKIGRIFKIKSQTLHELPSLSTTPYGFAPTRFYRFGAPSSGYSGISLFPQLHAPSGFAIRISKLFKPVKGSYEKITAWAKGQPKGSWGVIGPKMYVGGPEAEINIFGTTSLKRYLATGSTKLLHKIKGYEYYSKVPLEGGLTEVVPIVFTKPIHYGFPAATELLSSKITTKAKDFFSIYSSTGAKTIPIINPSYILSKIGYGYSFPSTPSYPSIPSMPSYPSKPSYPSIPSMFSYPSKPSYPSYPSAPSKPSYPSYPSVISKPSYPSIPSMPSYPSSFVSSSKASFPYYPSSSNSGKRRKPKHELEAMLSSGYRIRTWKVPTMEQFLKGGIY